MHNIGHIKYTMFDSGGRLCIGNIQGEADIIRRMDANDIADYNNKQNPFSQFLEVTEVTYYSE